jgi:hypothetical protein
MSYFSPGIRVTEEPTAPRGDRGNMKTLKKLGVTLGVIASLYLLLPLVVFDFTSVAVPFDEDNFGTQQVAIGPKPQWWIPNAAYDFDVPGGFGYDPGGWPFVVWKPFCVAFVRIRGYALPAEWR